MLYKVPAQDLLLRNAFDALRPSGKLMLEDWMLLPSATQADLDELDSHFESRHFGRADEVLAGVVRAGFVITGVRDMGDIGRTHLAAHFQGQFDRVVRPRLVADFPDKGETWSDQFSAAVATTIRLYKQFRMTYLRIVADRPGPQV